MAELLRIALDSINIGIAGAAVLAAVVGCARASTRRKAVRR